MISHSRQSGGACSHTKETCSLSKKKLIERTTKIVLKEILQMLESGVVCCQRFWESNCYQKTDKEEHKVRLRKGKLSLK